MVSQTTYSVEIHIHVPGTKLLVSNYITVLPGAASVGTPAGRAPACIPPRGRSSLPPPAGLLLVSSRTTQYIHTPEANKCYVGTRYLLRYC